MASGFTVTNGAHCLSRQCVAVWRPAGFTFVIGDPAALGI